MYLVIRPWIQAYLYMYIYMCINARTAFRHHVRGDVARSVDATPSILATNRQHQDPVVQSVVSLTSSLRVISLTVLADSIYNILIFFVEKM